MKETFLLYTTLCVSLSMGANKWHEYNKAKAHNDTAMHLIEVHGERDFNKGLRICDSTWRSITPANELHKYRSLTQRHMIEKTFKKK